MTDQDKRDDKRRDDDSPFDDRLGADGKSENKHERGTEITPPAEGSINEPVNPPFHLDEPEREGVPEAERPRAPDEPPPPVPNPPPNEARTEPGEAPPAEANAGDEEADEGDDPDDLEEEIDEAEGEGDFKSTHHRPSKTTTHKKGKRG